MRPPKCSNSGEWPEIINYPDIVNRWTARAHDLPVLTVVFNNRAWNAVKRSVTSHAPKGWAVRSGAMPMSELDPAPDYEGIARACGNWAERVDDPTVLPEMLRQALRVVREDRRPALLRSA